MPCIACSVVPCGDNWIVEREATMRGPYRSHELALRAAVAEALDLRRQGHRARVCARNRNGEVSAEACLCATFKDALG